ncbi:MAG TPA: hypothetical protein VGW12_15590 [Pyrinomonadaceae bacterium]|nr:hypothetical protein [Pyrinomonadaceae bacterium]
MAQAIEAERTDTLLALSIAFGHRLPEGVEGERDDAEDTNQSSEFGLFDALGETARQSLVRRAQWYSKLAPDKQRHWLARTLARAHPGVAQLDEHVHPSHILEALRDEPPRVRALILRHLPAPLAAACDAALNEQSAQSSANAPLMEDAEEPSPEIVALVRKVFLSNFVAPGELRNPSPIESSTGAELARLVRLLGVRETAVACRGIERAEAVGSFLRRFSAENARAILAHMQTLVNVEPERVALSETLVHEAMEHEQEPEAMLDRLGMRVLAAALAARESESERATYVAQKLPLEAARALRSMVGDCCARYEHEMVRIIGREAESLAQSLHHVKTTRTAGGVSKQVSAAASRVERDEREEIKTSAKRESRK